jgi:hypothetical protein
MPDINQITNDPTRVHTDPNGTLERAEDVNNPLQFGVAGSWQLDMHFQAALVVMESARYQDDERLAQMQVPPPGYAPAGGLRVDGNKVVTAGGYEIIAEGGTNVTIKGPDGEQILRVWGDPHVNEGSGGHAWDFTKDSVFVLEDGTRITFDTNYDHTAGTSQSVTTGLSITTADGCETAAVSGAASGTPTVHAVNSSESIDFARRMGAQDYQQVMDRFLIDDNTTDDDAVDVYRIRNGMADGKIDDAAGTFRSDDNGVQIYDQKISSTDMPAGFGQQPTTSDGILTAKDFAGGIFAEEPQTPGGEYANNVLTATEMMYDVHVRLEGVGQFTTSANLAWQQTTGSSTYGPNGMTYAGSVAGGSQGVALTPLAGASVSGTEFAGQTYGAAGPFGATYGGSFVGSGYTASTGPAATGYLSPEYAGALGGMIDVLDSVETMRISAKAAAAQQGVDG